jgi:mutator protein MutT
LTVPGPPEQLSKSLNERENMEQKRAAFVFLVRNNEVVFVRHTESSNNPADTYGIPGGRIEAGEEPRDAAVREVFEETGLTVQPSNLIELGTHSKDIETSRGMETWTGTLYLCREFHGEIRRMEASEEPGWVRVDDVLAGKYRMPRMSSEYYGFIMATLRSQI